LHAEAAARLEIIERLSVDSEGKDRLISSLHAAAERARAESQEKDRLIASLHAEAAARLDIIERLKAELRTFVAQS
jgi:hypothetical protein